MMYLHTLLLTLCTTILAISSLWLIVGLLGQFSLCHAGFLAIGAYSGALFTMALSRHGLLRTPLFSSIIICIALLVGGIMGGLAGFLAGLPAAKLKKEHITLSTLAFGEILKSIIINTPYLGGQGFSQGSAGQSLIGIPRLFGTGFIVTVTLLCLVLLWCIKASSFGRACRAVRDDEAAAQSVGLQPHRIKIMAFCLSGVIAGVSGSLFAHGIGTLAPGSFSYVKSTEYAIFCVPAGDSLLSAVLWSIAGVFLPALLAPLGKHRMLILSFCILVFILYQAKKGKRYEK